MFTVKGSKKEDFRRVLEEMGETPSATAKLAELRNLIESNERYREDTGFWREFLITTIEDRKAEEREKRQEREKQEQMERERQEREKQEQMEKEKRQEREREKQEQMEKEKRQEREREKQEQMEREKRQEREREKQEQMEREKQEQMERDKQREQEQMERDKQREHELQLARLEHELQLARLQQGQGIRTEERVSDDFNTTSYRLDRISVERFHRELKEEEKERNERWERERQERNERWETKRKEREERWKREYEKRKEEMSDLEEESDSEEEPVDVGVGDEVEEVGRGEVETKEVGVEVDRLESEEVEMDAQKDDEMKERKAEVTHAKRRGKVADVKYAEDSGHEEMYLESEDETPKKKNPRAEKKEERSIGRQEKPTKYTGDCGSEVEEGQPSEKEDYNLGMKADSEEKAIWNYQRKLWCFRGGTRS